MGDLGSSIFVESRESEEDKMEEESSTSAIMEKTPQLQFSTLPVFI